MRTMSIFVCTLLLSCASDNSVADDSTELGERGPQGDVGPRGHAGPEGPVGSQGDVGLEGPEGQQGPQGDVGISGDVGVTGAVGSQGPQGFQGNTGNVGSIGLQGPEGPQGPASSERMIYVSSIGEVLGLMVMTSTPTHNNGMVMSPGYYSEGNTIPADWVVPSTPTTIYWSGTPCGTGTPYLRVGEYRPLIENQLYWTPGSSLYSIAGQAAIEDNVLVKSIQAPVGAYSSTCSYSSLNTYIDDMMALDIIPVASLPINFPWIVTTEN